MNEKELRLAMHGCESIGGRLNPKTEICEIPGHMARKLNDERIYNVDISRGLRELKFRLLEEGRRADEINKEVGYEEAGHRIAMLKQDQKLTEAIDKWIKEEDETFKKWGEAHGY